MSETFELISVVIAGVGAVSTLAAALFRSPKPPQTPRKERAVPRQAVETLCEKV